MEFQQAVNCFPDTDKKQSEVMSSLQDSLCPNYVLKLYKTFSEFSCS